jgi:hypothetical protein
MRSPLFDIFDPYQELNNQQFYDQDDLLAPPRKRDPTISDLMPEEEKQSLLRSAANMGASGVSGLGWLLDTPGAVIRGLASGGPAKAISALWESSGDRVEGRELLRQYGLVGDQDNWQNWAAGFAGEVLLDPLTYMNPLAVLGRGAYGKGARAADRAGLLENIDLIAKAENKGTRELMRDMTVGQLVSHPQTGKDAFERLALAARGKGLDVDDIMKERLSGIA